MLTTFVYFLLITICYINVQSGQSILVAQNLALEPYKIKQSVKMNFCQVTIEGLTLYKCNDFAYLTSENSPVRTFPRANITRSSVLEAHIDNKTIILIDEEKIVVLRGFASSEIIYFNEKETSLLARIKANPEYKLVAEIRRTFKIYDNNTLLSRNSDFDILDGSESLSHGAQYLIYITLFGRTFSGQRVLFPTDLFPFELKDDSFKDAIIYTDPLYGHDYFIVGMQEGWLAIFKSLFQNAEMELLTRFRIEEESEILGMKIHESFLFLLIKNAHNHLKIMTYRLNTYSSFSIKDECILDIPQGFACEYVPQFKVKEYQDWLVLMINFPGEKILIYEILKPTPGYTKLECPSKVDTMIYEDTFPNIQVGYSFDFIIEPQQQSFYEKGVLLSPITQNLESSFFIPYCVSDESSQGPMSCGFNRLPSISQNILSICPNPIIKWDPVIETIESISALIDNHTDTCISCVEYMHELGAVLPADGFWEPNFNGGCQLDCKKGIANNQIGQCIDVEESRIIDDPCSQLTDCMNCSLSQTCTWSGSSCHTSIPREGRPSKKLFFIENVAEPAQKCKAREPCGQLEFDSVSGTIELSQENIYKNQFCSWKIQPSERFNNKITLRIVTEDLVQNDLNSYPTLIIHYSAYNVSELKKRSFLTTVDLSQKYLEAEILATELSISMIVQDSIIGSAKNFRIEFEVSSILNPLEDIVALFRWIYYVVFLFALCSCILTAYRDIGNYYRRRRFMFELQALNTEDDGLDDKNHSSLEIGQIFKNHKLVSKIVHDDGRQIDYDQTECVICLEDFRSGENLAAFVCKHVFHIKCFETWATSLNAKLSIKCPICNKCFI